MIYLPGKEFAEENYVYLSYTANATKWSTLQSSNDRKEQKNTAGYGGTKNEISTNWEQFLLGNTNTRIIFLRTHV